MYCVPKDVFDSYACLGRPNDTREILTFSRREKKNINFFFFNKKLKSYLVVGFGLRFSIQIFRMNRDGKIFKLPVDTTISIVSTPNEISDVKSPPSRNLSVRTLPIVVRFAPPRVLGLHCKTNAFLGLLLDIKLLCNS